MTALTQLIINLKKMISLLCHYSGISMESLCNSASRLDEATVQHCLRALKALLGTSWPRSQMGKDSVLSRELLNVMHRLVVTPSVIAYFQQKTYLIFTNHRHKNYHRADL